MKINQPVTQKEKPFPSGKYVVSKTDLKGIITYANDAFVELSEFSADELLGKNHNIVRHPDMPPQAFQYLWDTIKDGRPWRGVVKNRAKSGDHYWVDAFVVPVRQNDQTVGYMSVRSEPSRAQIKAAEALYAELNRTKATIDAKGSWRKRITVRTRLIAVMAFMALMIVGGAAVGIGGIAMSNQDLQNAFQDHLKPSLAIAKMIERLGDSRAQALLALQHAPESPSAKLHDHPIAVHIDAIRKNDEIVGSLRADYAKRAKAPKEETLAKAFIDACDALARDGNAPAREALGAGDYGKASSLLLTKINPLYEDVISRGDALGKYITESGDEDFAESQARYQIIRNFGIGGTLLGLLLVAVAGAFLVRAIVDPIRRAIAHFDRISQNVLTDEIDISGHDEAGHLMHALATMQVHLKVMLDEIRLASGAIDDQCRVLNDEMNHVVDQSREQRDRVQSVAATTEEFTATVAEVADSAGRTAEAAGHSRTLVGDSTTSMSRSMDATSRVVAAVQASSTNIGELNHAIQKIGDITNTIKEIADQTNLLALNAAIEAARAGEQGRGFAVVADEVRKLAERTSASTGDITATVAEFRKVTDSAVGSMEQAVQEVEQGIGMMRASVGGLDEIKSSSDNVADMSEHIATAARQQAAASADVSANMEKISALIEQNTSIALEAWQTVEDLSHTAGSLRAMVEQFKLVTRG